MDLKLFDPDDSDNSKKTQLDKDIELMNNNIEKFDQMTFKAIENMLKELENMGFNEEQKFLAMWVISIRMKDMCEAILKQEVITAEIYMARLEGKPGMEFG